MPRAYWTVRLVIIIDTQQHSPTVRGLDPVLTNLATSVFRPMAAMAMTIMNELSDFSTENTSSAIVR